MRVICIAGKAGSGKDTFAGFLKESLESRGKRVMIAHYADLVKYVCRTFCGWNGEKDEAGRSLLQKVGTDIFRRKDPDYWVRFLMDMLDAFRDDWDYALIPDCRFPNECVTPLERGFDTTLVRVVRPGMTSGLTEEQKRHASECALDGMEEDVTVYNEWDLDDLRTAAEGIAEEFCRQ